MPKNVRIETPYATFNIGNLEGEYHEGDAYVAANAESNARAWRDAKAAQSEARHPGAMNGDLVGGRTIINGKVRSPKAPSNTARRPQRIESTPESPVPLAEPVDASPRKPMTEATIPGAEGEVLFPEVPQAVGELAVSTTVAQRNPGFAIHNSALAQQLISSVEARFGNNLHNGGAP